MKEYLYFYEQRTRYHSKLIVLTRERKKEYFERGKNNFVIKLEQFSRDNGNSVFLEPTKRRCKKISARYEEKERKKRRKKYRNSLKQLTTRMECSARTNRRWRNRFQSTTFSEVPASFRVCFHSNFPLLKSDLVQS